MRVESSAFSSTISPSDLASFIVIVVCERFPGRTRTILTSRSDKEDEKIRIKANVSKRRMDRSRKIVVAFSALKLHAAVRNRIWYSGGVAPSRMGREKSTTCHIHIYIHTLLVNRRGITNERKSHVIGNDLLLHIPHPVPYLLCRVSKKQEGPTGVSICFIQPYVSGTMNIRAFSIVRSRVSDSNTYECPLTRRKSDGPKRLIVVPHGDGIHSIVGSK